MIDSLTPESIAVGILLLLEVHEGSVLVLEGWSDMRIYGKFTDGEQCQLVNAHNKDNVIRVIQLLDKEDTEGVLGIVDADFNHVTHALSSGENLLLTDSHDIETMIVQTPAFDHLLVEFGSASKIRTFRQKSEQGIRNKILVTTYPIGCLRFISERDQLSLRFRGMRFGRFTRAGKKLVLSTERMVETVLNFSQRHDLDKNDLVNEIELLGDSDIDLWQLTCGHDFAAVLSISLRRMLGSNNAAEIQPKVIEASLRLAYQFHHFQSSALYAGIVNWERLSGYRLLEQPG